MEFEASDIEERDPFLELDKNVSKLARLGGLAIVTAILVTVILSLTSIKLYADLRDVVEQRAAETKQASENAVARCISLNAQGPAMLRLANAVGRSPTTNERIQREIINFAIVYLRNTPTKAECRDLATQLRVPIRELG